MVRYPHKVINVPGDRRSVSIRDLDPASKYSLEMVAVSHEETRSNMIISGFRTESGKTSHFLTTIVLLISG